MGRLRYDKVTKEFVTIEEWYARRSTGDVNSPTVMKSFDPFKSPLDGRMISDRRQLAEHNKQHGVTNIADYGQKHFDDAGKRMYNERIGNTPEAEQERRDLIINELHKAGMT